MLQVTEALQGLLDSLSSLCRAAVSQWKLLERSYLGPLSREGHSAREDL